MQGPGPRFHCTECADILASDQKYAEWKDALVAKLQAIIVYSSLRPHEVLNPLS